VRSFCSITDSVLTIDYRGSMWQGVMSTPAPSALTTRDPRPLRERSYQQEARKEIAAWLTETGWPCSPQTLSNITAKDFRAIFQHLVVLLDPNYPFDPNARLEDDFVPALKCMKYPFVNQLDTKWLVTPASMHAWPPLLGTLQWLVEAGKVRSNYLKCLDQSIIAAVPYAVMLQYCVHSLAIVLMNTCIT
jgi:kinetochore protein NDC80